VLQDKLEDNQKTVSQFRTLVSELQNSQQSLQRQQTMSASSNKDEQSKLQEVMARSIKMQSQMNEVRQQSIQYGLALMREEQAQQQMAFVKVRRHSLIISAGVSRDICSLLVLNAMPALFATSEALIAPSASSLLCSARSHDLLKRFLSAICSQC